MKLNNFKKTCICILFLLSPFAKAAMLYPSAMTLTSNVYGGGAAKNVSDTFNGDIGTYQVSASLVIQQDFGEPITAISSTSATISQTGLSISASSPYGTYLDFDYPNPDQPYGGYTDTTMSFFLNETSSLDFQWIGVGIYSDSGSTGEIRNAAGDIIISCAAQCWDATPYTGNALPLPSDMGSLLLDSGDYSLVVKSFVYQAGPGIWRGGSGSFSLEGTTVVPVPAAVWLFSSGLIGLSTLALGRRKKTINSQLKSHR